MSLSELSELARSWWGLWLMLLFVVVVVWAVWPSEKRRREMRDHAMIPFREDDESAPDAESR